MKKPFTLVAAALTCVSVAAQSPNIPTAEYAPISQGNNQNPTPQSPWQVLFSYDITSAGLGTGNAGVVPFATNFWVSKWASDTISIVTAAGTLSSQFTVAGVSGIRSMTTDGSFIYAGTNTADIKKIDPVTHTLVTTISVPAVPNVRYCTYDATANSNAGGFWVGSWATDFNLVDMSGNFITSVAASSHALTATYGLAFDNTSPGGPYLWAFHQTSASNAADLIQVQISTGLQTTVMHDVTADMGTAGDLAGGVYVNPAPLAIVGVLQGGSNLLFSYDIVGVSGIEGMNSADFISAYPNPAGNTVNIRVNRTNNDPMQISIVNAMGQVVSSSNNVGVNNVYNIENLEAGVYFVQVTCNGVMHTTKIVKQ